MLAKGRDRPKSKYWRSGRKTEIQRSLSVVCAQIRSVTRIRPSQKKVRSELSFAAHPLLATGPTVTPRPERATRAGFSLRVVDALLMRTTNDAIYHRYRANLMSTQEDGDFGANRHIAAHVAALGEPSVQIDRIGIRCRDNADRHLAGTPVIRAIERDGRDRIAAKSSFCFLFQPLIWLPLALHRLVPVSTGANTRAR